MLTARVTLAVGLPYLLVNRALDQHLDWLHFAVEKLQTKMQKYDDFLLTIFIYGNVKGPDEKKVKRTSKLWQN